jgi:hypothetical protein
MYSGKLLMVGRGTAQNMEFLDKNTFGKISVSVGFIEKEICKLFFVGVY